MSVVSASWRTHARARIRTPHVNTGRKREKKGEESTEVHASPPSLYRCCYVTGLRRLELTTIPPPLSRRGSVNSTKLTRRSPVFATSRRTGRDPRIATRCIRLLGRDSDRRGLLLLLAIFRAEYFRFRFWELDDDDDVSGVRGVDRIDRRISKGGWSWHGLWDRGGGERFGDLCGLFIRKDDEGAVGLDVRYRMRN